MKLINKIIKYYNNLDFNKLLLFYLFARVIDYTTTLLVVNNITIIESNILYNYFIGLSTLLFTIIYTIITILLLKLFLYFKNNYLSLVFWDYSKYIIICYSVLILFTGLSNLRFL